MLCMTHVISFYYGKSHINGPKRSVPWCCKSHMWQDFTSEMSANVCTKKKVQYHNAVNDTRYLILFWEYPTQCIKKKDVYDTCYFILLWKISHKWPKKARYHDAAYDTCYFILLWKISRKWPKKARYHDAVYDTCYFILFWKISHKWPKKDRYHDAVNHTCDNTSLAKCLQTFATELDAIMCLMSKTEQFEFRTIKCHIETLFKSFCV